MRDANELRSNDTAAHTNFTMLPNIIKHFDLSLYERSLYLCLCMTVGYGKDRQLCYKSIDTLAKECDMSRTSVIKARKTLEERGFITVGKHKDVNIISYVIDVVDIWANNKEFFKSSSPPMDGSNT